MIDYSCTEIVTYADNVDNKPTVVVQYGGSDYTFYLEDLFPDIIDRDPIINMYRVETTDNNDYLYFNIGGDLTQYETKNGFVDYAKSLYNSNLYTVTVNSTVIHDIYISSYGKSPRYGNEVAHVSKTDSVIKFGYAPYVYAHVKSHVAQITSFSPLIRVFNEYLPDGYSSTLDDLSSLGGSDIYWLYNVGSSLVGISGTINEFLNIQIGGHNLVTVLFGSGFLIYVSWVIVKWVIPV